jgi:choline monooxygenase
MSSEFNAMIAGLQPALEAVGQPIEFAKGLPNELFTSDRYFTVERDQLFGRSWAVIGAGIDVPDPGDLKPVTFMGLPLLMLRNKAGEIGVFHNVCSHRGLELVNEKKNVSRLIRCPYHAWSFTLDGDLHQTPGIGGPGVNTCPGFEKARHGLKPVRCAVWMDMVFVNLSGDAQPFEDFIAPLTERWRDYDFSRMTHGGDHSSWSLVLNANWKFGVENHCDGYHLPMVHPELNAVSRLEDHYPIVGPEGYYAGQGSIAYNAMRPNNAPALPQFPKLPADRHSLAEYVSLFPNATIGVHMDHVWTVWFDPISPNRTVERMEIYYPTEEAARPEFAPVREEVHRFWYKVWQEDLWAVEGLQRGRSSPGFAGGAFSPVMDGPSHSFHKWAAASLLKNAGLATAH